MNEFELRRDLGALPRKRLPERDLWPGILSRMDRPEARSRRKPWPWLALAAAAALAVALLPAALDDLQAPSVPIQVAANEVSPPPLRAGFDALVGSASALPTWMLGDPEVLAAIQELEESTRELHHLISEHPEATHLVPLLHAAYDQHRWLNRFGVGQGSFIPPQES